MSAIYRCDECGEERDREQLFAEVRQWVQKIGGNRNRRRFQVSTGRDLCETCIKRIQGEASNTGKESA